MKFLSDILAKAGLTVDGVVTLNNTATGQTPDANDNSTKLATTAWVRTFVQPYSLPIATASVLGGVKVGQGLSIDAGTGVLSTSGGASITSFRAEYIITATAGQTTFTVPNGYTPGKIDLFLNGVYLNDTIYTATNSSTIVLDDAAVVDDILTVFVYSIYYVGESPSARTTTYFTATSNQTVFTVDYVIGQVDIFYNGSKLEPSEYTANNGTSITLLTPAITGDKIEVVNWAVGGGIASTRTITINGITFDLSADRIWTLTTANISEVTNLYYTDARARAAISVTGSGSYNSSTGVITVTGGVTSVNTLTGDITLTTTNIGEGTNLYYTNARSRAAISLTTNGTSGAATYDNATGVINIPQYQGGVTSFNTRTGAVTLSSSDVTTALGYTPVTDARTLTINGTTYDLSANRSWTIAPDTSVRNIYGFTATANQTTFTVSGGYTVGLVDVFINGVKLAAADFTATNGTTVVLATGTGVGNIVEIIKYVSAFTAAQEALNGTGLVRMSGTTVSYDNATYATQSYVTTAVANLVNAAPSTLDTLNELATALGNDANFATTVTTSIATKQAQLNGTGFVKISGTTISYDNSTYLTTGTASSTYLPLSGGTLTGPLLGTSATFTSFNQASNFISDGSQFFSFTLKGRSSDNFGAFGFYSNNGATRYGYIQSGSTNGGQVVLNGDGGGSVTLDNRGLNVTGAATFSSSVTAASLKIENTGVPGFIYFNNTSAPASNYIALGSGANEMYFHVNGSDRIVIKDNGNVGIGTATPTDFGSTYKVLSIDGAGGGGVLDLMNGGTRSLTLGVDASEPSISSRINGNPIVFRTNSGGTVTERMRITSVGEVNIGGFGTVFPVLTVKGIANSPHIGSTWQVSANQDGTGRTIIGTAGQGRSMYFENNGDVVIPNNRLEVSGTGHISTFTHAPLFHGRKLLLHGPTSSTTINLVTEFPLMGLVTGNVWAVFGKYCGLTSSGGSEAREFYISRSSGGTWSGTEYGPTANTGGSLSSVGGSGTNLVIGTTANAYFGLELTVMIR